MENKYTKKDFEDLIIIAYDNGYDTCDLKECLESENPWESYRKRCRETSYSKQFYTALEEPLENMPLYINEYHLYIPSNRNLVAKLRLKIGK